jgi:tetratricopeptide (TPR) repeat protein
MPMRRRRPILAFALALAAVLSPRALAASPGSAELRARAADLAYNLDHTDAIRLLEQAIAEAPDDPANHRALASTLWLRILFLRGAVTVDHYLGSLSRPQVDLARPPADLDAQFKREIATAIDLARKRIAATPGSAAAHHDLGAALGLQASYTASVEGRLMAGFRAARASYDEEERVLSLDPSMKQAGLIVGTYRYLVSTLSLPMRLMAYVAGFGGGRDRGLQMIEDATTVSAENRTDARFALVLLYNREKRYSDAIAVLDELHRQYPRNRLVVLEAGATALRGGDPAAAERRLTAGLGMFADDRRDKIPGEAGLWHLKRGAARVQLGRREDALADLRVALDPGGAGWVQGRAHIELARLALKGGDTRTARAEAALAIDLCGRHADPQCVAEAKRIK